MPRKKRPEGTRAPNGAGSIYLGKDGYWHGRVTVGAKDNGEPDRRHVKRKSEAEVVKEVQRLTALRDSGSVPKPGRVPSVEQWLTHWYENIKAPNVRATTAAAYRTAVYYHLIPGLGKHRLDKIQPDHFEKLYQKIIKGGARPATAHQVHRTARTAFGEAQRRGIITKNPVALATAPRVEEDEIEPFDLAEVQRLIEAALTHRNGVRFVLALTTGLRQGEVLGLEWANVDLELGVLRVRKQRVWPRYKHGCPEDESCGRKHAGYCTARINTQPTTSVVKSRAAKRPFPIPGHLVALLKEHQDAQAKEQERAGGSWAGGGWVFATETGEILHPRTDWDNWKALLKEAGVRDARLHDARHTAATNLLLAGVLDRVAQGLMGWSDASMAKRYQHLTAPVQQDAAKRLGDLLWKPPTSPEAGNN